MFKEKIKAKRPWGGYTLIKRKKKYWFKKLFIRSKERFSLQSHKNRSELWIVLKGKIIARIGNKSRSAKKGDIFWVPKKTKHRIAAKEDAIVLEMAFGEKLKEGDIIRYEDDYGRAI